MMLAMSTLDWSQWGRWKCETEICVTNVFKNAAWDY